MSVTQNTIKCFEVLGEGEIGLPIANELLAYKHEVRLFTRRGSNNFSVSALESKGAIRVKVDYNSDASIEAALSSGVDVIIPAVGGEAADPIEAHVAKVASKVGGVKLFVPSLWGLDYTDPVVSDPATFHPAVAAKLFLLAKLEALGLPWIAISNGLFSSWSFFPGFGIDAAARTAQLRIDGA